MIITIDTSSLIKGLEKDIQSIKEGIEDGLRQVASEIATMQSDIISERVGGDGTYIRSGKLQSGITIMPLEWSANLASITIDNTTSYAIWNNSGSGEFADNGQGRKGGWYYPVGDGTYRFTLGMKPKHFVDDSYTYYKDKAPYIVQQAIYDKL